MPPVAAAGLAAGGAAASGAGGKKAQKKALQLQQQQLDFEKGAFAKGMTAWEPSRDYWGALLSGDTQRATSAVGPYADMIRQGTNARIRQMSSMTPAGGARNMAIAQAGNQGYNDMNRLWAGMQPTAANALAGLSAQLTPTALSATNSTSTNASNQQMGLAQSLKQGAGNAASGLGSLLYKMQQGKPAGNGGGQQSPVWV